MEPLSPAQADAVLSHLSAEYDAAERDVLARSYGFWDTTTGPTIAKAIRDSKASQIRALRAAAERNPDRFAQLALDAEKDLRDLASYSQEATVQTVLLATAGQTVKDAATLAGEGAAAIAGLIPWQLYIVVGVVLAGVALYYLPRRRA